MANLEVKPKEKTHKKKRKLRNAEEEIEERPSKTSHVQVTVEVENEETVRREKSQQLDDGPPSPWKNLQLVLTLQNKDIDLQKKVQVASDYVKLKVNEEKDGSSHGSETVSDSRVIIFLNNWVQSSFISSEKKIRAERYKPQLEITGSCLDHRCWKIFKFCLEESLKLQVSLSFSRDFLRVVHCILRDLLYRLSAAPPLSEDSLLSGEVFELYGIVLCCTSLVFLSHGGVSNDNLDLWVLTVESVIELVQKVLIDKLDGSEMGIFVLQLSCYLLEPFAKFLRVHPTRKNGFRDFIDKLLEHMLSLLDVLHLHVHGNKTEWTRNLSKLVEEVLCQGLFHPTHIDGFLSLQSRLKYISSDDGITKDLRTVIKSYHRHLFEKLEKIIAGKNVLALGGIGELFHLFVDCIKKQKGVSENSQCLSNMNAETRRSMFDFFIQIMEPLLLEANAYLQVELEAGPSLMDVHCTLRSINKILASFLHDKVYLRTDDNTAGYCLNFLNVVYDMVMSYSPRINQLWSSTFELDNGTYTEVLKLVAKELVIMVRFLLEVEYEVVGNDLESLWLMTFSYGALGLSLMGGPDQCSLAQELLQLGCQLVNLYGELRQVNSAIFALCKAVRLLVLPDSESQRCCSKLIPAIPSMQSESYEKSVRLLLCSQEFSLAISNAIKSVPEGQASGCIRQLTTDISESMEWMKVNSSFTAGNEVEKRDQSTCGKLCFNLQAELLGKGLSELYTLVLESLTVTTGNSNLIGVAVKDLMIVVRPYMSALAAVRPDCVSEFLSTILGRTFNQGVGSRSDFLSSHWVVLFFFRLYMSSRSLYRQAISLVSPDISKKMSGLLGDSSTAYSGRDWLERTDWTDEGYFSWIVQPSPSLLSVIQAISDIYLQETVVECSPLIYALNAMALQRLVDLNRLIKSFEYILLRNDHLIPKKTMDDAGISLHHRKTRKWKSYVSEFRQEAAGLTNFMMGYLPLVAKITSDDVYKDISARALHENDAWNFSVGSVNEKSLPSAFWWIVCRNIDIWCTHAAKKNLKMLLLLLIQNSLPSVESTLDGYGEHISSKPGHLNEVTVNQISLELLSNTVLYEQRFVRRYMASRFCRILEKSILHIFSDYEEVDLNLSPNWPEFLSALDDSTNDVSSYKHVMNGCSSAAEPISQSFDKLPEECCKEKKMSPFIGGDFTACQRLLNLLCWMPTGFLSSRSFSLYGTCILNLERLVVGSLLGCHGALWSVNHYELFRLFVSCRRTLKYLLLASCEEKVEASQSSLAQILSESSFPILWLLKSLSAVIGLQHTFSEDHASQVKYMIFSLTDHTSYVFLTLSKDQSIHAVHFLKNSRTPNEEQLSSDVVHEQSGLIEIDPCLDSSTYKDSWSILVLIADTLKEETRKLHLSLKEAVCDRKVKGCVLELRRLSAIISCFQGFLWGLASAFDHVDAKGSNIRSKLSRWKFEPIYQVNVCINVFADFVNYFLRVLLLEDDQLPQSLCDPQTFANAINTSASSDIKDDSNKSGRKKKSHLQDAESILNKVDLFEQQNLNKSLLQGFLRGENPEASFFLRQLFITSSAILRLNMQMNFTSLSPSLVPIFIGISEVLLLEFANNAEAPQPFSFVWLDGVIKFLEELGSHFPLINPTSSRSMYVKIIDLHMRTIGKCISLQGKGATLASHETESSTKTLNSQMGLSKSTLSHKPYCLDEFKVRLRTSFKVFVNKSSELHLLSAIQALERALVGVEEGCTMVYNIYIGSSDGGKVSSIVAAAIDCLDSILEFVTGHKRLSLVKRHIQSLVSCLFNIVLHLQGPAIFYRNVNPNTGDTEPDPGSVILMCVEVLTRVFGKHALYQMDSSHVGHSLRITAALFQNFLHLRFSDPSALSICTRFSDTRDTGSMESIESTVVDRQFTVDLYAVCCRLLSTVLKHHKSECERSIALLETSVCVLLHCLERVDVDPVARKDFFVWAVQEGVKCAGFLRRIYEEMRQQKDVYGRHCFLFLSNYIWIYSGFGPLKTGIRRELDEALRPGVYALIDACSAEDLQYLHTVFGEGPCRSTLATLQHDYKLNFQYEGKV